MLAGRGTVVITAQQIAAVAKVIEQEASSNSQ